MDWTSIRCGMGVAVGIMFMIYVVTKWFEKHKGS